MSATDILAAAFPIVLALIMGVLGTLRGFWREAIVSASIVLGLLIVQQWAPIWSSDVYTVYTGMAPDMLQVVLSGLLLVLVVLVLGYGLGSLVRRVPVSGGSRTGGLLLGLANGAALGGWILRYIYTGLDGAQASSPLYQNGITQGFMIWAGWFPVALAVLGAIVALIAPFKRQQVEVTQTAPVATTPVAPQPSPASWYPTPPATITTSTTQTSAYGAPAYGATPYNQPSYGATPYAPPAATPYTPPAPTPYTPSAYTPAPAPTPYVPPQSAATGRMSGPVAASTPYDPTLAYPTQYGSAPSMPSAGASLAPADAVDRSAELRSITQPEPAQKPYDPDTAGVSTVGLGTPSSDDRALPPTSVLSETGTYGSTSASSGISGGTEPANVEDSGSRDAQSTLVYSPGDSTTDAPTPDTLPDALQRSPDWLGTPTTSHSVVSTESTTAPADNTTDSTTVTTSASTIVEPERGEVDVASTNSDVGSTQEIPVAAMSTTTEASTEQEHRCPNCGSEVLGNAMFCTECGTRLRQA